jgi:hypothetical protein
MPYNSEANFRTRSYIARTALPVEQLQIFVRPAPFDNSLH